MSAGDCFIIAAILGGAYVVYCGLELVAKAVEKRDKN